LLENPYNITKIALGKLLNYLGNLKFQFSADVKENANKLHFYNLIAFAIHTKILIFPVFDITGDGYSSYNSIHNRYILSIKIRPIRVGLLVSTYQTRRHCRADIQKALI